MKVPKIYNIANIEGKTILTGATCYSKATAQNLVDTQTKRIRRVLMVDNNDEMTIMARCKDWDIFKPDYDYLNNYPSVTIASLVAQSVGMHPYFAVPSWVFNFAIPYFEGERDQDIDNEVDQGQDAERLAILKEFLRRIHIAVGNVAPSGELVAIDSVAQGEQSVIKKTDFIAFAISKSWTLPNEWLAAVVVDNVGAGNQDCTGQTSLKIFQANMNDNEFVFSGLLDIPARVDDWFEVIDAMTKIYSFEHGVMPTKVQAWAQLCTNPPSGYSIETCDNQSLKMPGTTKPLNNRSFGRRWDKYTAKSNHFKPN